MPQQRHSAAWSVAAAALGMALSAAAWFVGPVGGRGLGETASRAVALASADDPACREALARYIREAARAEAAFPLPTALGFAAARDRAGEAYLALGCPAGPLLGALGLVREASRGMS